jgi:hypothetical protein
MRNALGLTPRGRNLSYRNHFCLYPGSDTYLTWCSLVERKLAEVQSIETTHGIYPDLGRMRTFTVTDLGRVLISRNRKRR